MTIPRIVKIIGSIDDNLISNAVAYEGRKSQYIRYYKIAVAACLVIVLAIPTTIMLKNQGDIPDNQYKDFFEAIEEITWDDTDNMGEKYATAMFNDIAYTTTGKCLATDYVDELLKEIEVIGYDEKNVEHHIRAEVYSIKRISNECGIALKFVDTEGYYIYTNSSYQPQTLQGFVDDLDLNSTLKIYSFEHDNIYYEGCKTDGVLNLLNIEHATLVDITREELVNCKEVMALSVSIPEIGCVNQGIVLYEKGYLSTNILSTRKTYKVGEEEIKEVVNYVMKNCEKMKDIE